MSVREPQPEPPAFMVKSPSVVLSDVLADAAPLMVFSPPMSPNSPRSPAHDSNRASPTSSINSLETAPLNQFKSELEKLGKRLSLFSLSPAKPAANSEGATSASQTLQLQLPPKTKQRRGSLDNNQPSLARSMTQSLRSQTRRSTDASLGPRPSDGSSLASRPHHSLSSSSLFDEPQTNLDLIDSLLAVNNEPRSPSLPSRSTLQAAARTKTDLIRAVQKRAEVIAQLFDKRRSLTQQLASDLTNYRAWRVDSLLSQARRLLHLKFMNVIQLRMNREEWALAVLQNRVDLISQAIESHDEWQDIDFESLLTTPRKLIETGHNAAIANEFNTQIKESEQAASRAETRFLSMQKRVDSKWTDETRRMTVQAVVESAPSETSCSYHHDTNEVLLKQLARAVADTRTIHGRQLAAAVRHLLSEPNPAQIDIQGSVQMLAESIVDDYKLDSEQSIWYIRLLLDKLIFPPVHSRLMDLASLTDPTLNELDEKWEGYARKLQRMTARQLQVDEAFLPSSTSDDKLFPSAINTLSDLPLLQAPGDMVLCITTAVQEMGEDALFQLDQRSRDLVAAAQGGSSLDHAHKPDSSRLRSTGQAAKALNADTMLPMAAFCIIRSNTWRIHHVIWFIKTYADDSFKTGRFGYCIATIEAAVCDIMLRLGPLLTGEKEQQQSTA